MSRVILPGQQPEQPEMDIETLTQIVAQIAGRQQMFEQLFAGTVYTLAVNLGIIEEQGDESEAGDAS